VEGHVVRSLEREDVQRHRLVFPIIFFKQVEEEKVSFWMKRRQKKTGELVKTNFVTPICARVGIASIRTRTFHFNAVKR
jgi:hypothetical protein